MAHPRQNSEQMTDARRYQSDRCVWLDFSSQVFTIPFVNMIMQTLARLACGFLYSIFFTFQDNRMVNTIRTNMEDHAQSQIHTQWHFLKLVDTPKYIKGKCKKGFKIFGGWWQIDKAMTNPDLNPAVASAIVLVLPLTSFYTDCVNASAIAFLTSICDCCSSLKNKQSQSIYVMRLIKFYIRRLCHLVIGFLRDFHIELKPMLKMQIYFSIVSLNLSCRQWLFCS